MTGRVLVIDDSMVTRRQVQLAVDEVTVETAPSLEAGLAAAMSNRPNLILLDDGLPGTPLQTALEAITACEHLRGVSLVLLTDSQRSLAELRAAHPQMVNVLRKPLDRDAVREVIDSLLVPSDRENLAALSVDKVEVVREVLDALVKTHLSNIPRWEQTRNGEKPEAYFFAKLFPLRVVQRLALRLSAAQVMPSHHVAVWDKNRDEVVSPLLAWLANWHGLMGVDLTIEADPLPTVLKAPPRLLVADAETVGPETVSEMLRQLTTVSPSTTVVVICGPSLSARRSEWELSGAAAVLEKPFRLRDLDRWLPRLTADRNLTATGSASEISVSGE